ncbi:biofilm PGA synthesis lipoprotein PgaB [Actinobacillus equuli]|nr:biofilm PGA synthesis lipoprotein PgaB [Actinobacillus equuli]
MVDESAPKDKRLYVSQTITAQQLISHFNWFKAQGYNVVSWQQVMDAEQGKTTLPPKAVLISFDDGYETMYSVIYPLLKAYNYPAVFAPVSSWIDTPMGGKIQYGNENWIVLSISRLGSKLMRCKERLSRNRFTYA